MSPDDFMRTIVAFDKCAVDTVKESSSSEYVTNQVIERKIFKMVVLDCGHIFTIIHSKSCGELGGRQFCTACKRG